MQQSITTSKVELSVTNLFLEFQLMDVLTPYLILILMKSELQLTAQANKVMQLEKRDIWRTTR